MVKCKELQEWSEYIWPILTDVNIAIANLRIINIECSKGHQIIRHGFFGEYWHQQRFILVVQLAKIFSNSKNQKKNINKICSRFENESIDNKLKILLKENSQKLFVDAFRSREDILKGINELKLKLTTCKNTIDSVETWRDKFYAHSDSKTKKDLPELTLDKLEEMVSLANEVFNTMYGRIFDRHANLDMTADFDLRYIIKLIGNNKI